MAYLKRPQSRGHPRFDAVATEYMRYGEMLGVRGTMPTPLSDYHRDRLPQLPARVKPMQTIWPARRHRWRSSLARVQGIGAVCAPTSNICCFMPATRCENPTRRAHAQGAGVGLLAKWQAGSNAHRFQRPRRAMAPGSRGYGKMLEAIGERFGEFCAQPDPRPQLVQEARAGQKAKLRPDRRGKPRAPSGANLARSRRRRGQGAGERPRFGARRAGVASKDLP